MTKKEKFIEWMNTYDYSNVLNSIILYISLFK